VTIVIVDYGVGNLASVGRALTFVGATTVRATGPDALDGAAGIVVPGVGHFASTAALNAVWRNALGGAIERGVPLLGICLGMQWLLDGSTEAAEIAGLGVFRGRCETLSGDVKVPHVGWNTLDVPAPGSRLLTGVRAGAAAYFTHSFAAPITEDTVARTTHGTTFASVVERGRVFGTQWHPEKSGAVGLRLLGNFVEVARRAASC